MNSAEQHVRGFLSLLFHGQKAIDVVETALALGILEELDRGPVTVGALARKLGLVPARLSKFLDCLESLGLVVHDAPAGELEDEPTEERYRSVTPLVEPVRAVVGRESIERDRERHAWRSLHGRLADVLAGAPGVPESDFAWPPSTPEQVRTFEQSMSAGIDPVARSFEDAREAVLEGFPATREVRWLDVGGGDGALAERLALSPRLRVDVFNLPAVRPVFELRKAASPAAARLAFVGGDFLAEPLPGGYDVLSFVRVLHDWPLRVARDLLRKAHAALPPGGRVVISEELRTPDRLALQFFWSYFLIGVDSCGSRLRPLEQYMTLLREERFTRIRLCPGAFDILVATRA